MESRRAHINRADVIASLQRFRDHSGLHDLTNKDLTVSHRQVPFGVWTMAQEVAARKYAAVTFEVTRRDTTSQYGTCLGVGDREERTTGGL